jgi:hypothetical protein
MLEVFYVNKCNLAWQLLYKLIMEKRAFERAEATLPVKYFCENTQYAGTVKNLSENGMFISTSDFLPCGNTVELLVPLKEKVSKFSARIKRIVKINESKYNIGVELLDPPENYLEFVSILKSTCKT